MKTKLKNKRFLLPGAGVFLLVVLILSAALLSRYPAGEVSDTGDGSKQQTEDNKQQNADAPFPENPYGEEDFGYDGDYLTCLAGESILGVDVSQFQGQIDWQKVASAGVKFAMIRVGGRGYGAAGGLYGDDLARANYEGARAAGLKVGVYFFSQAVNREEAREEADFVLEKIAGWQLDMPVVFDWEYMGETARTANVDKRTLTDCALAFCQGVESSGREAMCYFNPDHAENYLYLEELTDYRFWLAMYTDRMTYPYQIDMWQYTREGTVPGITGLVDINLYFPYGA